MTINEFLKELAKTPRDWQRHGNWIRGGRQDTQGRAMGCPLQAVFGPNYCSAARIAGMSGHNTGLVMNAADNAGAPKLRTRLLQACGLRGEATER